MHFWSSHWSAFCHLIILAARKVHGKRLRMSSSPSPSLSLAHGQTPIRSTGVRRNGGQWDEQGSDYVVLLKPDPGPLATRVTWHGAGEGGSYKHTYNPQIKITLQTRPLAFHGPYLTASFLIGMLKEGEEYNGRFVTFYSMGFPQLSLSLVSFG